MRPASPKPRQSFVPANVRTVADLFAAIWLLPVGSNARSSVLKDSGPMQASRPATSRHSLPRPIHYRAGVNRSGSREEMEMGKRQRELLQEAHPIHFDARITYGRAVKKYGARLVHGLMDQGKIYLDEVLNKNCAAFDPANAKQTMTLKTNGTHVG
jgi:hypothetical protein